MEPSSSTKSASSHNVIVVVLDSLRQDHVSYYGSVKPFENVPQCKTPNLDRFAGESVVFRNAYPMAMPTIPIRAELMTGMVNLPTKGWSPLYPTEASISEILKRHGYKTGLIADTYHLFKPGMNYHKGFDSFEWIRGQEYDTFNPGRPRKKNVKDYVNKNYYRPYTNLRSHVGLFGTWTGKVLDWTGVVERYLANTDDFVEEKDWLTSKVFESASKWVDRMRGEGDAHLLWVDSFDPHEPWDPPPRFDTYTDSRYAGARLIMPQGGEAKEWATPEEIDFIRGLYAGEVSFVDDCFGKFYDRLASSGALEDTVVVVLGDHGHPLADHGKFLKGADRMYSELLKVPFMVRLPGKTRAMTTDAIIQYPDVLPTVLEYLGFANETSSMSGRSFSRVLTGEASEHREFAICGYPDGIDRSIRDKEWSYIERPNPADSELYNLRLDPRERKNVIKENGAVAERLKGAFSVSFRNNSARLPPGQGRHELSGTSLLS